MSRAVLVKEPLQYETCEGCGNDIIRNKARLDGKPYHFGCLKRTKARPTHYCLDSFSYLTGSNIVRTQWDPNTRPFLSCGHCGSSNLKPLGRKGWPSH